ncbi:magnesium/cobalt transporter CorA [Alkalilimnicola ehrlichii]|uniref:magnesium/cobalt transporter CorA n=2 Tax=Alkalilimnicola ehrlichii TaxID=351052 RepID=UPI0015F29B7C|nr:magnesium/cobalt transporter CorA [Alkalilimnicola ehrlichii]
MKYISKTRNPPGSPPGQWQDSAGSECRITLIRYTAEAYQAVEAFDIARCREWLGRGETLWLDIEGTPGPELLRDVAELFSVHHLVLEDICHPGQRAKVEDYERYLFLVLRRPRWSDHGLSLRQVSLLLGEHFVISIDDDAGDDQFAPVRRRLEAAPEGRLRTSGTDYLFYALTDLLVDQGFPVLERYADELEALEAAILEDPRQPGLMDRIHRARRELVFLHRALWSQQEVTEMLLRHDSPLITPASEVFLRDCADHARHLLEQADSYREMSRAMLDLLMSAVNQQMNDIMRVLTIIATTFIPLSVIVGIYGMNFDTGASPWNMPELGWRYGYPAVLALLAVVGGAMLIYFRRKRWL